MECCHAAEQVRARAAPLVGRCLKCRSDALSGGHDVLGLSRDSGIRNPRNAGASEVDAIHTAAYEFPLRSDRAA